MEPAHAFCCRSQPRRRLLPSSPQRQSCRSQPLIQSAWCRSNSSCGCRSSKRKARARLPLGLAAGLLLGTSLASCRACSGQASEYSSAGPRAWPSLVQGSRVPDVPSTAMAARRCRRAGISLIRELQAVCQSWALIQSARIVGGPAVEQFTVPIQNSGAHTTGAQIQAEHQLRHAWLSACEVRRLSPPRLPREP